MRPAGSTSVKALKGGAQGVFVLVRSAWLESKARYSAIFKSRPPTVIAQFVERVPMFSGRYNANGSTATAYAWVGWAPAFPYGDTRFLFIPPCRLRLERAADIRRWCQPESLPLFEGGGSA